MAEGAARASERTKPKAKRRRVKDAMAVEVESDAWERFEKAVGKIAPPRQPKVPQTKGSAR